MGLLSFLRLLRLLGTSERMYTALRCWPPMKSVRVQRRYLVRVVSCVVLRASCVVRRVSIRSSHHASGYAMKSLVRGSASRWVKRIELAETIAFADKDALCCSKPIRFMS